MHRLIHARQGFELVFERFEPLHGRAQFVGAGLDVHVDATCGVKPCLDQHQRGNLQIGIPGTQSIEAFERNSVLVQNDLKSRHLLFIEQ